MKIFKNKSLRSKSFHKLNFHYFNSKNFSSPTITPNSCSFAIVGSGPGGIYTAKHLLKKFSDIQIDFYEKLPHPFGLVRTGVSPDHQDVKHVQKDFMSLLEDERVRFLGNADIGQNIPLNILKDNYSGVVLAYGAGGEKKLNIKGEDSYGVFSAKNFVNWYNGHILFSKTSEFNNFNFNLVDTAVIIGNGNVAIDISRILSKDVSNLNSFDMPESVLKVLSAKNIKNIHIVGRRGVLEAAFTIKELRELSKVENVKIYTIKEEIEKSLENFSVSDSILPAERRHINRKIDLIKSFESIPSEELEEKSNRCSVETRIFLRFLLTPVEILINQNLNNLVEGIKFQKKTNNNINEEIIKTSLIFKSIGYKGEPIDSEINFDDKFNVIKNTNGVVDGSKNIFCVGWIKTGPKGIIDHTLRDSYDTAESIIKSISIGNLETKTPDYNFILSKIKEKGKFPFILEDWKKVDAYEIKEGQKHQKIREKILDLDKMISIV